MVAGGEISSPATGRDDCTTTDIIKIITTYSIINAHGRLQLLLCKDSHPEHAPAEPHGLVVPRPRRPRQEAFRVLFIDGASPNALCSKLGGLADVAASRPHLNCF